MKLDVFAGDKALLQSVSDEMSAFETAVLRVKSAMHNAAQDGLRETSVRFSDKKVMRSIMMALGEEQIEAHSLPIEEGDLASTYTLHINW